MLPGVREANLLGAVRYFDGLTNDARLVLDTLVSAARHGAIVLNYMEFLDSAPEGPMWGCRVRDWLGEPPNTIYPPAVSSTPRAPGRRNSAQWSAAAFDQGRASRNRRGTPAFAQRRGNDGRSEDPLRHPLGRAGDPGDDRHRLFRSARSGCRRTRQDIEYILAIVNESFPAARLSPTDVISHWAGLRPLIDTGRGGPSDISRAHQIDMPHPRWFDVAGGKLTTYRRIAQQVVDRVGRYQSRKVARCRTATEPLLLPGDRPEFSGILPPPISREVVEHGCRREWAVHLDDMMIRRTSWHYYHADAAKIAAEVAGWMAALFGWDAIRQAEEVQRYGRLIPGGSV